MKALIPKKTSWEKAPEISVIDYSLLVKVFRRVLTHYLEGTAV